MKKFASGPVIRAAKIILSVFILLLLAWIADPQQLLLSLSEVSLSDFAVLMLISFVLIAVSALKWKFFIDALGDTVPFINLFNLYLTGYFINIIFPSYIGGDALRSYYVGKTVGQHKALSATFLERYTGLLAMALLGMFAALYDDDLINMPTRAVVIGLGLAVIALTVAAFFFSLDALKFRSAIVRRIASSVSKLHELIMQTSRRPELWFKTMGLSFFYHSLTVLNTYIAALAVGWSEPPVAELFVVLPIILIIGALPLTPSGLGIQEGAFFHFLQMLGATSPQALGVAVVLRAKTYVLALIGWGVWNISGKGGLPKKTV